MIMKRAFSFMLLTFFSSVNFCPFPLSLVDSLKRVLVSNNNNNYVIGYLLSEIWHLQLFEVFS